MKASKQSTEHYPKQLQQQQPKAPPQQQKPAPKTGKNVNRRNQVLSMGGGSNLAQQAPLSLNQQQITWNQTSKEGQPLDLRPPGQGQQFHMRNATQQFHNTHMNPTSSQIQPQPQQQRQQVVRYQTSQQQVGGGKQGSVQANPQPNRASKSKSTQQQAGMPSGTTLQKDGSQLGGVHHQKNFSVAQQPSQANNFMMGIGSPQSNPSNYAFNSNQKGQFIAQPQPQQQRSLQPKTGASSGGKTQGRRNQSQTQTQQAQQNQHHRGRSSGAVFQQKGSPSIGTNASAFMQQNSNEIQQILLQQQQQMSQTAGAQQFNYQFSNPGGNSGTNNASGQNPFRSRQKQQAKKYQQSLQMYSSSNRILNNNQVKPNNSALRQQRQQASIFQQDQQQQLIQNYNDSINSKLAQPAGQPHVRSLSNCSQNNSTGSRPQGSNQFGSQNYAALSQMNKNLLNHQNIIINQQQFTQPPKLADAQGRKAPSSINLLNQTSIQNNLTNSRGGMQMPNIAHITAKGQIANTHQNLLIQPQFSHNLIQQQKEEDKVTEKQVLESEEFFESGKVFLTDKKYKEASKMFTKSLKANKTNYDALFYRAVTHLDQELPEQAIADLEELMKICSDYRETMFIVLSIAYRRVNDYLSAIRTLSKAIQKYPNYLEAYIARGQIYIFQKKWDSALSDFKTVLKHSPNNGMGYLGQGDSLKGLNMIEEAIKSYSQVIEVDPQAMCQGLMKRGLLYLQLKQTEEALKDFNKLTEMAENQNQDFQATSLSKAYFYKAKALKKMNNLNDSVLYFEQVLRLGEDNFLSGSALYEIAKIKIQHKDFYEAYYNLQRQTTLNLRQKKLQNYKLFTEGVIFMMKRKTKTGVKLLSQVIERMKSTGQPLKKIDDKINNNQSQESLKSESDNERKSNESPPVDPSNLVGDEKDYIYPLLYIYRAYGYIILEEYDKGLKDFLKSSQIKKLNNSQHYNMILCQGLKNLENKEYESAITFFTKSSQKQPKKRDPYLLRAMSIVEYTVNKPIKPKTKTKMFKDAKKDLNRALENSPKDEQVLFLRGLLNFALHRFYDAIQDFERVIEKTDETNAVHYLARGRCYACLSMFKEAITDLSIAINLNKDLLDAYLNRGKCAYLIGDTGLAFMDFQKLIVLEPKNPSVHIYAGNLLMTTGSYDDATKAFTNADNIHKSPLALYQRSRCHVALNNMQEALEDLNKVIEISTNDKVAIQDRECLNALRQCSISAPEGEAEEEIDKGSFQKAAQTLTKLISYEKNENLAKITHESSIQHQHSQIIPSAHRTKMDKIRAIRRRKEQDRIQKEDPENGKKNDLRFRVQQDQEQDDVDEYEDISELDDREIEKLNRKLARTESNELDQGSSDEEEEDEQEANYYKENIFNKEDFFLYRAIFFIYGGKFDKATADLEQCSQIMHQNKVLYPKNQFPDKDLDDGYESPTGIGNVNAQNDDNVSNGSSQTDLSDVGLCSLNIHEFSFNLALCMILSGEYAQALSKLDYIIDTIAKKYAHQLWLIRGILNEILGYTQQAEKDFKRAYKYDAENAKKFLDDQEDVKLNIFPQQSRLCSFFQYIPVEFQGFERVGVAKIHLKPSFSFPFIKPPNMIPCVDQNLVLEQFALKKSNVSLKPEAPWIKKCQFGIKFTEEILYTDDDREPTPDDEKEYKKRKQRQQERAMEGAGFIRAHSEKVELKYNIFAEDNQAEEEGGEPAQAEGQEDQQYVYQDENGNPINLAELAELGDIANIGELADLENYEGLEETLAEQMKILKDMQKQQQIQQLKKEEEKEKLKQEALEGMKKEEMQIEDQMDEQPIDLDMEAMEGMVESSPENNFNKLQNITNLKDIAKEVQDDLEDDYEQDIEEFIDEKED